MELRARAFIDLDEHFFQTAELRLCTVQPHCGVVTHVCYT
jgi:hypothetical protein